MKLNEPDNMKDPSEDIPYFEEPEEEMI